MLQRVYKKLRPDWVFWEDYVIEDNMDGKGPTFRTLKELKDIPTSEEVEQALIQVEEEIKKEQLIQSYKDIEKIAIEKRSEYLTVELLPEGEFKTFKLNKIEVERIEIEKIFNDKMTELISIYGKDIFKDL